MMKLIQYILKQDPSKIRWGQNVLIAGTLFFVTCTLIYFLFLRSNWTDSNISETKRRGNQIIAAIDAYFKKRGSYPKKLEDLIPDYIDKIYPPTVGKKKWFYGIDDSEKEFCLIAQNKTIDEMYPWLCYSSRDKYWEYTQSSY